MSKIPKSLSVVVISHNQKYELRRCINSIFNQKTDFPVEIIVSDDRSTDGTREMLLSDYREKVISTFFNSDDYETSYVLERSALNRINGLKKATGKYLIHIDGDDFFRGTDLFQVMVDKLEAHPECNLCCQNYLIMPYDKLNQKKKPVKPPRLFKDEPIISGAAFINIAGVWHNSCFCMRRTENVIIENLTSNSYDDIDITLRYLGNGYVALVDKCDFVYVQYSNSSCSSLSLREQHIVFQSYILDIPLVPQYAGLILKKYIKSVLRISLEIVRSRILSVRLVDYCRKYDLIMFKNLECNIGLLNRFRFLKIALCAILVKFIPFDSKRFLCQLYKLVVNDHIEDNVNL